jgi:hypothetical protein
MRRDGKTLALLSFAPLFFGRVVAFFMVPVLRPSSPSENA